MAVYNQEHSFQSILNAALGEYHSKGFRLVEPDTHILELYHNDDIVGRFNQTRATVPVIHGACQAYLETLTG